MSVQVQHTWVTQQAHIYLWKNVETKDVLMEITLLELTNTRRTFQIIDYHNM